MQWSDDRKSRGSLSGTMRKTGNGLFYSLKGCRYQLSANLVAPLWASSV